MYDCNGRVKELTGADEDGGLKGTLYQRDGTLLLLLGN